MKRPFLKLLIITGVCLSTILSPNIDNGNYSLAQEIQTISNNSNDLNVEFFMREGDIIVGQLIFTDKYNFVKAKVSDDSITVDIVDEQVELYGLKPETNYRDISITLTDSSGTDYTFKINDFKTPNKNFIGYSMVSVNLHEGNFIARVDLPQNPSKPIEQIKSVEISDNSIVVNLDDGVITLHNLKNNTNYSNLMINIIDNNNNSFNSKLNTFYVPNKEIKSLYVKVSSYKNNYSGEILIPEDITPISAEISDKNLLVDTVDGDVTLLELKPETTYTNLILTITDDNNQKHIFKLNTFSTLNKNFSYADVEVIKNGDNINVKILLPEDLEISNAKISDSNIKFKIDKNQLILLNLEPNTLYDNLKIIVQDNENKLHNFVINEFSTSIANVNLEKLSSYIENSYKKAFDRDEIDKEGFDFWMEQLSLYKMGARDFILNILNTNEFLEVSKNSSDKITRIYAVMFNRTPDPEGLKYWINEYNKNFRKTNSQKASVTNVVTEMTNSEEFKKIISEIGIAY